MTNTLISLGRVVVTLLGLPLYNIAQKQAAKEDSNNIDKMHNNILRDS